MPTVSDLLFGVLLASAGLIATGVLAWLVRARPDRTQRIAQLGTMAASGLGFVCAILLLSTGRTVEAQLPWSLPLGEMRVGLDPLSALFLMPIFGLTFLAALYGRSYFAGQGGDERWGTQWLHLDSLAASMALVVVARDGVLFLLAWEVMALSPFFLVCHEHERETSRRAGWVYLVATHLGTACLLVMFLLLGREGSYSFAQLQAALETAPEIASPVFVLALIGFGTKAGFVPMHVWLPQAHPAAPSHASALLSGVMIKVGIYGLIRVLSWSTHPPAWWGWTLVAVGVTSGVFGVAFALGQHDLKRLLAYHSVENIGIIAIGLGLGVLGVSTASMTLAVVGFAGALFHVLNHSVFKSLLFFGAGAVLRQTGTVDIDRLGGLQRRMPWAAATFLIGSVAIVGLPPLNGFVSELLIFLASFTALSAEPSTLLTAIAAITGLGLISGLAAACFVKAYGTVFSGEPRSDPAEKATPVPAEMRVAMAILAAACIGIAAMSPWIVSGLLGPVVASTSLPPSAVSRELANVAVTLRFCLVGFAAMTGLAALLWWLRAALLRGRVSTAPTWGCGYVQPTARMQYTGSSFAQPLVRQLKALLRPITASDLPEGIFASPSHFRTEVPDLFERYVYGPLFRAIRSLAVRARVLQHGNIHVYVVYVAGTLLVLLIWKLS